MTVYSFPSTVSIARSGAKWGLLGNTVAGTSSLSGTVQTKEFPAPHWAGQITTVPLIGAARHDLAVFLAQLRGGGQRFYYGDPLYLKLGPQGTAGGTPLVNGTSQTGTSLITDGWNFSETVVKKGDYCHYDNASGGRELHLITADGTSDGSGNLTLPLEPPIRVSPADGAAITVTNAMAQMRLVDDAQAIMNQLENGFAAATLRFIEAFTDAA